MPDIGTLNVERETSLTAKKARRNKPRAPRKRPHRESVTAVVEIEPTELARREKYFEICVLAALFAFGLYNSVLYFGHTIVPNGDFPAFFRTGREILSLQAPYSFKRVPVLGILQVCLSWVVGGQHPGLTAGWLLNAILHPFNLILLWLVGKRIVGKSGLWIAIIAILNPQVMYLLTEPIAETTLLFFILLTFYFMFRRSKWCYLLASITTMVRYEGAALIMAAFVLDMIEGKSKRERIRSFVYSALASAPLALWMLGTLLSWGTESTHYLGLFGKEYAQYYEQSAQQRTGVVKHLNVLWQTGFKPLLMPYPQASGDFRTMLLKLSKTFALVGFSFGSIYGLLKRKWNILALLIFFVPYFAVHVKFPSPLMRYHMPIVWIGLLISWFGLQSAWQLLDKDGRVPTGLVLVLQGLTAVVIFVWSFSLFPYLPRASEASPRSASVPYVAMALVVLIFALRVYIYRVRYLLRELAILALLCLMIVSNQFQLAGTLRDGQKEKEFKLLADWYVAETEPGEKLALYMHGVVRMFAPRRSADIVPLPKADTPQEFTKSCYEQDITYVVWASREGRSTDHTGYRQFKYDQNLAVLGKPRSTPSYEFVTRVGSQRDYVHIFRLRRPRG